MEVLVVRKLVTGMRAEGWPQWPAPVWLGKGKGRRGTDRRRRGDCGE